MRALLPYRIAVVLGPLLIGLPAARAAHAPAKTSVRTDWIRTELSAPLIPRIPERAHLLLPEKITWFASSAEVRYIPPKRSQEWRLLPQPQSWEYFAEQAPPPPVDQTGFEIGSRMGRLAADRTAPSFMIASDRLAVSGEIINARTPFSQIGLGDPVFVRADESLQVGTVYSVTRGPEKVTSSRDGRIAFIYPISGKMKIIGVRDGMFIGTITELREPLARGNLLIPEVESLRFPPDVPAPTPFKASVLLPRELENNLVGQHELVFLDAGTAEGVAPGMVFRSYLKEDPNTGERLPTRDFMIESELQVLSAQDMFSIAIVLQSRSGLRNGTEVVALTDLKDLGRNQGLEGVLQDLPNETPLNELDLLDRTNGLGEKEDQDLRQLEKWKKPEASPGVGPGLYQEDIQKEIINPVETPAPDLGSEVAPNDGSGDLPPAPTPSPAPAETPETAPETPPGEEPLPPSPPSTPPSEEESSEDSGF